MSTPALERAQELPPPRCQAVRQLPPWKPTLVAAVAGVALLADLALRQPLASLATTLLVVGIAVLLAVAGKTRSLAQRCGLVLIVASGCVFTLRDSVWVAAVTASSVMALTALVASDGLVLGQRRPWARSISAGLDALVDTVPWLRAGVGQLSSRASGRVGVAVRAAAVGVGVAFVLGALLASGDAAFEWFVAIFDVVSWAGHLVAIAVLVVPATLLALIASRAEPEDLGVAAHSSSGRSFRVEALAAMWAAAATLLVWCGVQVAVVSGGARSVLVEQGLTAAEYARQGFFQLVTVAAISLAVVNTAHRVGRRHLTPDPAQRVPAAVVGLTLGVLIVVAFSRLGYYIGSFGLTMLRLSVATFLGWLGVMTAASVARSLGLHHERNWLPSAAVLSAALFAAAFGVANPEGRVAQVNLDRATVDDPADVGYLTRELGPDAAPIIADYRWSRLGGRPAEVTDWLCRNAEVASGSSPLGWNRSRSFDPYVACLNDD